MQGTSSAGSSCQVQLCPHVRMRLNGLSPVSVSSFQVFKFLFKRLAPKGL